MRTPPPLCFLFPLRLTPGVSCRKEDGSDHILLTQHGEPIGTIRWYPPMGKLGRLAVKKTGRGLGAGRILVRALEEHVAAGKAKAGVAQRASGVKEVLVVANSQAHAQVGLLRARRRASPGLCWDFRETADRFGYRGSMPSWATRLRGNTFWRCVSFLGVFAFGLSFGLTVSVSRRRMANPMSEWSRRSFFFNRAAMEMLKK